MAIGSNYYRDISKVEKQIWGMSKRQLKSYALLGGVSIILIVEALLLPDWAFYIVTVPTAFILGAYPMLLMLNMWKKIKRRMALHFIYEERLYTTGQIRRYEKHEFTQKKGISEADKI